MRLFFKKERDSDFYKVCCRISKSNKGYMSSMDIASKAILCEAESYYLTKKQMISIIQTMRANPDFETIKYKKSQSRDLICRYWHYKKIYPNNTIAKIVEEIDKEPAPRFYMTPRSADKLLRHLMTHKPCNTL